MESIIESHAKGNKSWVTCDDIATYKEDIDFPLKHKKCGGLIHFDATSYDDGCGYYDHSAKFECDKCGKRLDTWYDFSDDLNKEFFEIFGFYFVKAIKLWLWIKKEQGLKKQLNI